MVRVIMGVKGTGKTKQMIELINSAVHSENGNVVCIERGPKLTYDIHYKIRLVEASHYDIKSYDFLKGFISGLYAGNYDITHVFIDSLTKIVASEATDHAVEEFLDWLNSFSEKNNIKFTVTISADASLATEGPLPRSSLLPASNRLYIRHTAAELWIIYRLRGITAHDILFGEIKEV